VPGRRLQRRNRLTLYLARNRVGQTPALIGTTPQERATTSQWQRRVELNITENIHNAYHHAEGQARFAGFIPVVPEAAAGLKRVAQDRLAWLDGTLGAQPWLAGECLHRA